MLKYAVLSSGSIGNSYAFYDGKTTIMVDMGLSSSKCTELLEQSKIPLDSIRGIFITHLHPDHASDSLKTFVQNKNAKIYINRYAAKKEHKAFVRLKLMPSITDLYTLGETKVIGEFRIYALEAFHDSVGCVSYYITNGDKKITLITDTGYFSPEMIEYAGGSSLLFLESNYDDELLDNGSYPAWLKARVRGELGHLSNDQAVRFLTKLGTKNELKVHLIHISENNNTIDVVKKRSEHLVSNFSFIHPLARGEYFLGEL